MWIGFPLVFFIIATTLLLERTSTKSDRTDYFYYYRQFLFLTGCSFITYLIDLFGTPFLHAFLGESEILVIRLLIYPVVLVIGAMTVGGTPAVKIERDVNRYEYLEEDEKKTDLRR